MKKIRVLLIVSLVAVFLLLPNTVLAWDAKSDKAPIFCVGIWPAKISDGFTAADYRFQSRNYQGQSEWQPRIPIELRKDAGDERFVVDTYKPLEVDYTIPLEVTVMPQINYAAPPELSHIEKVRWGQALSTTRPYLARLWGISQDVAEKYGAKY